MNKKLEELKTSTLIFLIESPDSHSEFDVNTLKAEITSRDISKEELDAIILKENEMIARRVLEMDDITNENVNMHKSHFLSEDEIRDIYTELTRICRTS